MELGSVLYVYKGEWDLPSIDFECLRVMCLVRFPRCPLRIDTLANPLLSGAGRLPYLQVGSEKFVGYKEIKAFIDKAGFPINSYLDEQQKQQSMAYANWVFTNLHVYYHYFFFGHTQNYETTRALYAKRTPFPFNFYYPSKYQQAARDVVKVMAGFDLNETPEIDHDTEQIVWNAKNCVNCLSKKLGRMNWFFGNVFSELDVIAYAYLSLIYKATLPNNPLRNHIAGCKNLICFIARISHDIFRNETFSSQKTSNSSSPNDPMLTATERKFLESEKQTQIIAGIGAVIAMGSFAAWKGLYHQFSSSQRLLGGEEFSEAIEDDDDM